MYGPQKGATAAQVALLTRRLARLADVYGERTGVDVTELEGAGAAGGLAGGLAAIGAQLEPGFEVVAQAAGFERRARRRRSRRDGRGQASTPRASRARSWAVCSSGPPTQGVAHRVVIAGQATDEGRDELSVLGDVQLLTLTDRVWQAGEAFARAALLVEEAAVEAGRSR